MRHAEYYFRVPWAMSVPLPELESRLRAARKHYPGVEHSMRLRCGLLRAAHAKDPNRPLADDYVYRYKGQEWRCRVRVVEPTPVVHALLYWIHPPTGPNRHRALDAIMLRGHLFPLHFDSHLFSRWGLRSELMGVMLTNMMGLFRQYPHMPVIHTGKPRYPAQPVFAAALDQGLVLARQNGKRLISCDTFKDHDMLSADERLLWQRLRAKSHG